MIYTIDLVDRNAGILLSTLRGVAPNEQDALQHAIMRSPIPDRDKTALRCNLTQADSHLPTTRRYGYAVDGSKVQAF